MFVLCEVSAPTIDLCCESLAILFSLVYRSRAPLDSLGTPFGLDLSRVLKTRLKHPLFVCPTRCTWKFVEVGVLVPPPKVWSAPGLCPGSVTGALRDPACPAHKFLQHWCWLVCKPRLCLVLFVRILGSNSCLGIFYQSQELRKILLPPHPDREASWPCSPLSPPCGPLYDPLQRLGNNGGERHALHCHGQRWPQACVTPGVCWGCEACVTPGACWGCKACVTRSAFCIGSQRESYGSAIDREVFQNPEGLGHQILVLFRVRIE